MTSFFDLNYEGSTGPAGRYGSATPTKEGAGGVSGYGTGKGNVLGRGDDKDKDKDRGRDVRGGIGLVEREGNEADLRTQQHTKWEADKKTQKRITVLENRLRAQMVEVADLTAQLKKARETAQTAISAKDELAKRMNSPKFNQESKSPSLKDIGGLDNALAKIFTLEEENSRMHKRIKVEFPNEVSEGANK